MPPSKCRAHVIDTKQTGIFRMVSAEVITNYLTDSSGLSSINLLLKIVL